MGCCKTKIDENAGITYNEDDEIPQFDIQPKDNNVKVAKAGLLSNDNYGTSNDDISRARAREDYENPRFNRAFDDNSTNQNPETLNFNHNGMQGLLNYSKRLFLSIKESKYNKIGTTLEITPTGLVGSTRNANDGVVYFGLHSLDFKNDFCFKAEEGVNKQHFEIKFEKENRTGYYVKNLQGSGVFIKIEDYLNLKPGVIISFGTNHLLVSMYNSDFNDQKESASNITFKAIYGPNKGEE